MADLTNEQNFSQVFLVGTQIRDFKKNLRGKNISFKNKRTHWKSTTWTIRKSTDFIERPRIFEIEKVKQLLELQKHDTVLEINLNAILHNINVHKALLKPETKICTMVKAYSYGLGGYEIAEFFYNIIILIIWELPIQMKA